MPAAKRAGDRGLYIGRWPGARHSRRLYDESFCSPATRWLVVGGKVEATRRFDRGGAGKPFFDRAATLVSYTLVLGDDPASIPVVSGVARNRILFNAAISVFILKNTQPIAPRGCLITAGAAVIRADKLLRHQRDFGGL